MHGLQRSVFRKNGGPIRDCLHTFNSAVGSHTKEISSLESLFVFLYRQLGEIKTIPLAEPLFVDLEPVFVEIMFFNESCPVYKVNVAILVSVYNEESGIIFYQGYQKQACETQLQAAVCSEGT